MNKEKIYIVFKLKDFMKFIIVIIIYNCLNLLKWVINFVLEQIIKCERIVVDDCLIDDIEEYVKSLGDKFIYYCIIFNEGYVGVINLGVKNVQGDWVKFMDDDDYLVFYCIEEMIKVIIFYF